MDATVPARPAFERYLFAALAVMATLLLREALQLAVGAKTPFFLLLMIAPIAASLYGGRGPGWMATGAGAAFGYLSVTQPVSPHVLLEQVTYITAFVVVGGLVTWVIDSRARALRRMELEKVAIERRERRVREVLEAAPSAMLLFDPKGRIRLANGEAERLFGYTREELRELEVEQLIPDRFRGGHRERREGFLRAPTSRPMGAGRELYARRANGTEVPVEVGLRSFAGDDGVQVLATIVDVSARRALDAERAESEARFRSLAQTMPAFVFVADAGGLNVFTNERYQQYTGMTPQQLLGDGWLSVLHPDDRSGAAARWQAALADGREYEARYRFRRYDGLFRWHLLKCSPRPGGTDGTDRWYGTVMDIDDIVRAEHMLARQAALIDQSSDAIFVREFDGPITFWSRGAERLYGWTAAEMVGRIPHELLGNPGGDVRRAIKQDLLASGEWSGELKHRRKDGTPLTVLSRWSMTRGPDGNPREVLETNTDVTGVVAAREAMQQAAGQLREADRRKDEFLAVLSHELRNPLSPIRAGLQVLEGSDEPRVQQETRRMMRRQLSQLVRLVDDLLDVSRISTGKLRLARERFELGEALQHAIESVRPEIAQRGQTFEAELLGQEAYLVGDSVRVRQVFANLLNNASKYTPPGGRIRVRVELPAPGRVSVSVTDTGIGLAPEQMERVFELFTQVERAGRPREGLGIGLSLARQLVELHGGRLFATSGGEGQGSTFAVELPVAATLVPAVPSADGAASARRPRSFVVADDNRDAADSLAMILELAGHEVHVAYDGDEALAAVRRHAPDVAVLDIGMPRLTGYEVAQRVRTTAGGARVVLAALTGWGQEHDRARALASGFDRHFTKPVDPDQIDRMLDELERAGRFGSVAAEPATAGR
jgi:PAS domain S-box-containing protein